VTPGHEPRVPERDAGCTTRPTPGRSTSPNPSVSSNSTAHARGVGRSAQHRSSQRLQARLPGRGPGGDGTPANDSHRIALPRHQSSRPEHTAFCPSRPLRGHRRHPDRAFHEDLAAGYAELGRGEDAAERERLSQLAGQVNSPFGNRARGRGTATVVRTRADSSGAAQAPHSGVWLSSDLSTRQALLSRLVRRGSPRLRSDTCRSRTGSRRRS
jgi:hypothetical protein